MCGTSRSDTASLRTGLIAMNGGGNLGDRRPAIDDLLDEISPELVAQRVGSAHDTARLSYSCPVRGIATLSDFETAITDYYQHHFTSCIGRGGRISQVNARGRAREIVDASYRSRGGNFLSAFRECRDGIGHGLRGILDIICDELKAEGEERYIRDAFDRHVCPSSWRDRVDIMRQFLERYGTYIPCEGRRTPEEYANDYEDLILAYVHALRKVRSALHR